MTTKSDPVLKRMVEQDPHDWLLLSGQPPGATSVVDADLATVSVAADKLVRVRRGGVDDSLLHLEFHAGHDAVSLPRRVHLYNTLADQRHELPVHSVVFVLHRQADSPQLIGEWTRRLAGQPAHLQFRYQVVRVWQLPVAQLLAGGLGTLPLAPISNVAEDQLPAVIETMRTRLAQEASPEVAKDIWTATTVLMGFRYSEEFTQDLLKGVLHMEESVTYQAIIKIGEARGVQKGRVEEAQTILFRLGSKRFGEPDSRTRDRINQFTDAEAIEALVERLFEVATWKELLAKPSSKKS